MIVHKPRYEKPLFTILDREYRDEVGEARKRVIAKRILILNGFDSRDLLWLEASELACLLRLLRDAQDLITTEN